MTATRYGQAIFLIASGGCGKSYLAKQFGLKINQVKGEKVTVFVPGFADSTWYEFPKYDLTDPNQQKAYLEDKGISVIDLTDGAEEAFFFFYQNMEKGILKNTTIILDDAQNYMEDKNEIPPALYDIFSRLRNSSIDIIGTVHGLSEINSWFFKKITGYGFFISSGTDIYKISLPRKATILNIKDQIDTYVSQGGKDETGKWKKRQFVRFIDSFGQPLKIQ